MFALIIAFTENLCSDPEEGKIETHEQATKRMIYENAMIIAPKLKGAMGVDL